MAAMTETESEELEEQASRRGRPHDAKGAREAILNAAEAVFAEHGFDGARVDAIAERAGYNKSLLFQYFGNKLGLYTEVLKRADQDMSAVQAWVLTPLFLDDAIVANAATFKAALETIVSSLFDYILDHPLFMRMLLWEQAEGWTVYKQIVSQLASENVDPFEQLFRKAHSAGLLRSDFVPIIQLAMALQICLSYLSFVPLYQMLLPHEDLSSAAALARAREYVVTLIVAGMLKDFPETKETRETRETNK